MRIDRWVSALLSVPLMLGTATIAQGQTVAGRDVEGWMKSAKFIVGVYRVEDMLQIPGTRWIVGSGVTTQGPGMEDQVITKNYLHLFDAKTETGGAVPSSEIAIQADKTTYPEVFKIDVSGTRPRFTWVGTIQKLTEQATATGVWGGSEYGLPPYCYPEGLQTPKTVYNLTGELLQRGYSKADVAKIMGVNYLRVMKEVWG